MESIYPHPCRTSTRTQLRCITNAGSEPEIECIDRTTSPSGTRCRERITVTSACTTRLQYRLRRGGNTCYARNALAAASSSSSHSLCNIAWPMMGCSNTRSSRGEVNYVPRAAQTDDDVAAIRRRKRSMTATAPVWDRLLQAIKQTPRKYG